ncbi:MAG: hypothetical protein OEZ40_11065, partial [Candidatus Bathyarchaeota archaeon]|nr:hypothetical protein [Candidatus Bathyarchaeota archaeon]
MVSVTSKARNTEYGSTMKLIYGLVRAPLLTMYRWNRSGSLRSIALPWVVDATLDGMTIFSVVLMKRRRSLAFISFPHTMTTADIYG